MIVPKPFQLIKPILQDFVAGAVLCADNKFVPHAYTLYTRPVQN